MITEETLTTLRNNQNTGIEYEIAMFLKIKKHLNLEDDINNIQHYIRQRIDYNSIIDICNKIDLRPIIEHLKAQNKKLTDCKFETQNDNIGPADIVLELNYNNSITEYGISIKYNNTCTLNVTSRYFLSKEQIDDIESKQKEYSEKFIAEMNQTYGEINHWFRHRRRSTTSEEYIDLIRDAVISSWEGLPKKKELVDYLFQANSPIDYFIYEFTNNSPKIYFNPPKISHTRINDIVIRKLRTSYIGFYLDNKLIGKLQIKFNNGFLERCNPNGQPDFTINGTQILMGKPFSSWNFSTCFE